MVVKKITLESPAEEIGSLTPRLREMLMTGLISAVVIEVES